MRKSLHHILALLLATLMANAAPATTIQAFSLDELAAEASLIFQGRVIDQRADEGFDGLIYTWVRFEVDEVLKGETHGRLLELRFLGGETPGARLEVAGMHLPREGETGIYFVESLDRNLINPLLGWSQGHFLIEREGDGEAVVTSVDGQDPAAWLAAPTDPLAGKLASLKQGRSAAASDTLDPVTLSQQTAPIDTQDPVTLSQQTAPIDTQDPATLSQQTSPADTQNPATLSRQPTPADTQPPVTLRQQTAPTDTGRRTQATSTSTTTAEDFKQALRAALERAGQ